MQAHDLSRLLNSHDGLLGATHLAGRARAYTTVLATDDTLSLGHGTTVEVGADVRNLLGDDSTGGTGALSQSLMVEPTGNLLRRSLGVLDRENNTLASLGGGYANGIGGDRRVLGTQGQQSKRITYMHPASVL